MLKFKARATFNDPMNMMSWEVADWCNYKCSYCCEGRFAPSQAPQRFLSEALMEKASLFFSSLKDKWVVRLASGEPSTHPGLLELAKAVTSAGHRIDIVTNLSLPLARYERFVAAAGDGLKVVHASLHLEHVELEEFFAKCAALKKTMAATSKSSTICVSCVATHENMPALDRVVAAARRHDLIFILQRHLNPDSQVYDRYSEQEVAALRPYFEDSTSHKIENPTGKMCAAGQRWLLLDITGNLWRCHQDRGKGLNPLGNIGDAAFEFTPRGAFCRHEICGCPGGPITAEWPVI